MHTKMSCRNEAFSEEIFIMKVQERPELYDIRSSYIKTIKEERKHGQKLQMLS